jgi:hypothetical protein
MNRLHLAIVAVLAGGLPASAAVAQDVAVKQVEAHAEPLVVTEPTTPAAPKPPTTLPATAPAATEVEAAKIDALIKQLGTGSFAKRQEAEDALVQFGGVARPQLERAVKAATNEEQKSRIASALGRIAEEGAFGPTLVTLKLTDAPARKAIEQLSAQCGVAIEVMPPSLFTDEQVGTVTLDVTRKPFWEVMDQVAEQTGLELRPTGEGLKLMRTGRQRGNVPVAYSGAFLIAPESAVRQSSIYYGNGGNSSTDFNVSFSIVAEPKLQLGQGNGTGEGVKIDEAVDDNGNNLVDPARPGNVYGSGAGGWQMNVPLKILPNVGTAIKVMRGSVSVSINVRFDTVEIDNIASAKNVSRPVGGARLVIQKVEPAPENQIVVHAVLYRDGVDQADWDRMQQTVYSDLKVVDAKGRSLDRSGNEANGDGTKTELKMTFIRQEHMIRQNLIGEPAKLIWRVPTETRQVPVPFEFRDLPLPG